MRKYGLVLVACCGVGVGCGSKTPTRGDLSVSGSPTGEVDGPVRVVLAFSRPMVAQATVGTVVTSPPVAITPSMPGEARWSDDKTLVYTASGKLPVSTKFTVTVPGSAKALDGAVLGTPTTFEFFTERLTGTLEVVGSSDRATKDQLFKVSFNQDVAADQVTQSCSISGKTGAQKVKLAKDSSSGPSRSYTLQPSADLALDAGYTITCAAGLKGTVGNIGIDKPLQETFKTYGPLQFVSMDPTGNDIVPDENLQLKLAFTNPLAEPYQLSIEPKVPGFPQRCHSLGDSPAGVACGGLLEARTSYTLTIGKQQKDIFGQTIVAPQTIAFRTADAQPTISVESGYFVAELKRPVVPVWTRNVSEMEVTAVKLTQASFHELAPMLDWWETKPVDFASSKLRPVTKKVTVSGTKNQWGQQPIDPAALFGGTAGPGMYYVEIGSKEVQRGAFVDDGRAKILANFTDIGLVTKMAGSRGVAWATKLSTGKPLPGATITVRDGQGKQTWSGVTDAEGVVVLPGLSQLSGRAATEYARDLRVYASLGNDWTMVAPDRSSGLATWNFNVSSDYNKTPTKLRGFMHTDRGLYRPGDTVHVKGIARVTQLGGPLENPGAGKKVTVEITGPQGKTFASTEARLSPFGGFWFDVELPADARLGDYSVRAQLEHGTFYRTFTVEEFRTATYEVTGKSTSPPLVRKGNLEATINASYFYGAPLRGAPVEVAVHSRPRYVEFEQFGEYQFADERRYSYDYYGEDSDSQTLVTEDHLTLDDAGNGKIKIAIGPNDVYGDADLLVRASVESPANEVINKTFVVPYFNSKRYFGIKSPGWFLDIKKPAKFTVIAVGPDGKISDGPAKVTLTRRSWNCVWEDWGYNGSYNCDDETETIVDKVVHITGGKPVDVEFTPQKSGDYLLEVKGENDKAEAAAAAMSLYAWGDGDGSWRSDDSLKYDIIADKKEYKAGETATLILKTDLKEATGLVTIERDGVIEKRLIQVTPTAKHVTVPITAAYAPNIYVSVALVQGRMGDGTRGKPRMRMGLINLPVRPQDNRLTLAIETDKLDYRPGENVTAKVKVTDMNGAPVSAEVSITAADEGVLSLVGYKTPDPVPTFWAPWGLGVTSATQFEYIRDIPGPNVARPASGGDAAGTLRSRFVATAVWSPGVVTDGNGVATVKFVAPDNLTAFRVMAVAADKGYRFGSSDKRFTVSKPLQLHQSLPRFLSVGDELQGGVILHNETGAAGTATVKLVADDHVTVKGAMEQTIQVAKGARVPVLFSLTAANPGTTSLTFTATMGKEADAVELKLPISHPSPIRGVHVGAAAIKDAPAKVALTVPSDAIPGTVEAVVSVDPDGLSGIEDGLDELIRYPHGCLEQTTSKVIPMLAVRDLAESLDIDGLNGAALDDFVKEGIAKIGRHQTAYGGFSLWPGGEPSAYYTAYALWGLHLAKQAGYKVDSSRIEDALVYLRNDGKTPDTSHDFYDEAGNLGSQAFALYVRAVLGDKAAAADAATLAANPKLPIYGRAYVARTLAASVTAGAQDPAVAKILGELAALADDAGKNGTLIKEARDYAYYMSSSMRTTAMVLGTLVDLDPKNPAIKPLVATLMKERRKDPYLSTQENLYSLLALSRFAKTQAGNTPAVTVELAGAKLIEGTLAGKQRMRVARAPLAASGELVVTPRGGEVAYNVELRYRRKLELLKPEAAKGISIDYSYVDEKGSPKTSFTVGDVVVVKLTAKLDESSSHLIISKALPAGFEALNARFDTVGATVKQTEQWGTYSEMKDDRVNFTEEWGGRGEIEYAFTMRATSVGKFARPPTTAELMYEPETHAQTGFDIIEIKAK